MSAQQLSDEQVRELLVAVGAGAGVTVDDFTKSFEDLELDSLARTEIASRIQARFGVDVDEELTATETPAGMRVLVNHRLLPSVHPGGVR